MTEGGAVPGERRHHAGNAGVGHEASLVLGVRPERAVHVRHAQIARRANVSHPDGCCLVGQIRTILRGSRTRYEGRFAIVTNVGRGMRWTPHGQALLRKTTDDAADGEVVWSRRPDAGAKSEDVFASCG